MTPLCTALTDREEQVVALLAVSPRLTDKEIARHLGISRKTVDNHLQHIYRKLGVHDRMDAAFAAGLLRAA